MWKYYKPIPQGIINTVVLVSYKELFLTIAYTYRLVTSMSCYDLKIILDLISKHFSMLGMIY